MGETALKITYLGQCCFLLESEGVRVVTDPYLSDAVDRAHAGETPEWRRLYPAPCTLQELKPDIILISHEHDDHMDLVTLRAYREAGGNAIIAAPAPCCEPLRKLGFSRVVEARAEHIFPARGISITPIACAHTELTMDARGRFLNLSYIVDFGTQCVFFGGDMSVYDGLSERIALENCQALLLPCNGRDEERTSRGIIGNATAQEAAAFAADLNVPFLPMHHDLYAVNGCPAETIALAAKEAGADLRAPKPGESVLFEEEEY